MAEFAAVFIFSFLQISENKTFTFLSFLTSSSHQWVTMAANYPVRLTTKFNVGLFLLCHRPTGSAARRPNLSDNSAKFQTDEVDASLSETRYMVPIIPQWYCFSDFWTDVVVLTVLCCGYSQVLRSLEESHFFHCSHMLY